MANGIASVELVEAMGRAGFLGVFGAAGLSVERVEAAIDRLRHSLQGRPWAVNLIHSPDDQKLERALVDLFLDRRVPLVSASAYLDLTLPVVKWRVSGIHRNDRGEIVVNRLMAKVSRVEVARKFFEPPPERFLSELEAAKVLTAEQVELARQIPMADDVTAEADSGGHTDNRPLVLLLPALTALRDEISDARGYARRPRVGAGGGIATPASVASAFSMGAAYVVSGSINQATTEAGTSDVVRAMLAQAAVTDVAMAPAADMFEMGVKVQVLTRGTMFAPKAQRLYELYRNFESLDALPESVRHELETKYFRMPLDQAWAECEAFFEHRDRTQIERARREPKHRMALLFRSYLGQASKWANRGVADRALDFQVWCGPSMGAFNAWAKGSALEAWEARDAVTIARNLLIGACALTRVAALRTQGVALPSGVDAFRPRTAQGLDALVTETTLHQEAREAVAPSVDLSTRTAPPRKEPIAIVGIGALFPKAANVQALWGLLRRGEDAIGDIPPSHFSVGDYFDADAKAPDKIYARRGAFLPQTQFDPTEFGIPPTILEATDTSQLLALVVAKMALEDAGYPEDATWNRARTSVLLGVTGTQELVVSLGARLGHPRWRKALAEAGVDAQTADDVVERIAASYVGWQENSFPGLLGNVVAGRIANRFDLGGTNCVVDAACASSLGALHLAMAELESRRSDMVLTGGVDTLNDIFMHMCFTKTPALSPTDDVRPFSDKADGTLLGEGLGMVVLKRLADAERDGDRIYAVIRGLGTSSDGRAKSIYAPLPKGQARALRAAYADANVRPFDVTLLEAHGTGTKAGDAAEFEALSTVFREDAPDVGWCTLGSIKSQIGHTKAAAGAAGLIKVALALHHRVLPPTIKVDRPNPALDLGKSPFVLSNVARPWLRPQRGPRIAAVSSFGFGGSNFHAVLEEYGARATEPAWDGSVEIFAFAANDVAQLRAQVEAAFDEADTAAAAARSRRSFHCEKQKRLLVVLERGQTLRQVVSPLLPKLSGGDFVAEGVVFSQKARSGSLAFVFPGQGSQSVDMLRDLATVFPEISEAVGSNAEVAARVYPPPTFDEAARTSRHAELTKTDVAQPALGLVSRGLLQVLSRFGLSPDVVAGHSFGEVTALHAAGVLSTSEFDLVAVERGRLMAGGGDDRGTMLALMAPMAEIERFIEEERLDVVLANRNTPRQGVISGSRSAIERAEVAARARKLQSSRLNVGAAFHSALVASAAESFGASMQARSFQPPRIPVVSNVTGAPYPADPVEARALLATQLAKPVQFIEVVERLYDMGARTFVEVGPKSVLTGMVGAILGDKPHLALAVDAASSKGALFQLAWVLARLAAAGHSVNLQAWQHVREPPRSRLRSPRLPQMAVPLSGANVRSPVAPKPPRRKPEITNGVAVMKHHTVNGMPEGVAAKPVAREPVAHAEASTYWENLRALQALQEQTARVHQLFLENQLAAQNNIASLLGGEALEGARDSVVSSPVPPSFNPTKTHEASQPAPTVQKRESAPVDARQTLLEVVAETTGYPVGTLQLSMDLEADLGIDSIKRVEILSALSRKLPSAPSVEPEALSRLKTLEQVLAFVSPKAAASNHGAPSAAGLVSVGSTPSPRPEAKTAVFSTISELTGYPQETLSLSLDLEADLGIDSIKRVEILSTLSRKLPEAPSVDPEKLGGLRTIGDIVSFVQPSSAVQSPKVARSLEPSPSLAVDSSVVQRWVVTAVRAPSSIGRAVALPEGPVVVTDDDLPLAKALATCFERAGVSCIVGMPASGTIGGVIFTSAPEASWNASAEAAMRRAFRVVAQAGPRLRERKNSFVACVSRLDGAFGHAQPARVGNSLALGLGGLVKSLAREWAEVRCRSFDVAEAWGADEAAAALFEELTQEGPVELGLGPAGRVTLALQEAEVEQGGVVPLKPGDVVVVTGGARGVTAECARALAEKSGATLLLVGRSPMPTEEPEWLAGANDEATIKRRILEQSSGGAKLTPKQIAEAHRSVVAAREIRMTLSSLQQAGLRAEYRSVDVRDEKAVLDLFENVRREMGPIRGVVHGAGVLRDKRIEDKKDEDIAHVFDTKIAGLRAVLEATRNDSLAVVALFGSVSGRFGRRGQTDYAAANQALVSIGQAEALRRPQCRVVTMDWGPWAGGMVTPSLETTFASEGVGLIPLGEGAQAFVRELSVASRGAREVVIGKGVTVEATAEWTVGLSLRASPQSPMLDDHRLLGRAVVPLALSLEWIGAAASTKAQPGSFSLRDVRLLRGVVLDSTPVDLSVWCGPLEVKQGVRSVPLELRSKAEVVHVRATAVFEGGVAVEPLRAPSLLSPLSVETSALYATHLFHGPRLQVLRAVDGVSQEGIAFRVQSSRNSNGLLNGPPASWVFDPLSIDGAFQAIIVWAKEKIGSPSLPSKVATLRAHHQADGDDLRGIARIRSVEGATITADIDLFDSANRLVWEIRGAESTVSHGLLAAFHPEGAGAVVTSA
jgi:PfaD family protein